ncbi:stage III sporulation protein AG [Salipaludibacillus aurantiacus]|uniref:Stage III sporulation protein AG n=1 Tax=Salipaludibacillus aurantiacus TaxID=1601833 RepID=A0A1H9PLW7_9BACI|nr:stage III sporulation protein AG [Salipaludibacillus aurantiacus]SER49127.1 stage III sporulation protein AG [Salipaludibacillus aurantiacus]
MKKNSSEKSLFHSFSLNNKKGKKVRLSYFIVLILIGVFMMLIGSFLQKEEASEPVITALEAESNGEEEKETAVFKSENKAEDKGLKDEFEAYYEKQLKQALEEVVGVSNVTVMVNTAGSSKNIYEKNEQTKEQHTEETDREGGTREVTDTSKDEQVVIVRSGDKEEPLIIQQKKPEISGVLIVANGVDNIQVKTWVVEAVSRVLDIPSHRVSVMPRKQKEDVS